MCDTIGCVNYDGDEVPLKGNEVSICAGCIREKTEGYSEDDLYEIYLGSIERFIGDKYFRKQVRKDNGMDMNGDFDHDLEVFKKTMFDTVNSIMLIRENE